MSARKTVVHPAPPRDEGEGSSETNQVTAAGQDAEAVLPSGTSPGAAQEKVPAVSSAKDGSATSAFESAPAGDAEGQGSGASKEERGPSEKPRGDEAAAERVPTRTPRRWRVCSQERGARRPRTSCSGSMRRAT